MDGDSGTPILTVFLWTTMGLMYIYNQTSLYIYIKDINYKKKLNKPKQPKPIKTNKKIDKGLLINSHATESKTKTTEYSVL